MPKRTTFETIHQDAIIGKLTLPDRIIFKGHTSLADVKNFRVFLSRQGILLKHFKDYAPKVAGQLKQHAQQLAADAARPYLYLDSPHTARDDQSKEQLARNIAQRDGVTEGLICVLAVVEPCRSFKVRGNHRTKQLELVSAPRKCLQFYFYFSDAEFGFLHLRLQSWFPLQLQVYINGREWLCRQLDRQGIGYRRYDNALLQVDDLPLAQRLCQRFARKKWPRWLDGLAHLVNPWLRKLQRQGFAGYHWVTHQCELATDVMFKSRAHLRALLPDLFQHGVLKLSAEDTLRFLGRKLHGNFRGEVTVDLKRRPEGFRLKFRMKRNSIKMYDKYSVLRIETTINNPYEFKVRRPAPGRRRRRSLRWLPMGKGVANFWRYCQVGEQANARFLEAIAHARPQRQALDQLDRLSRSRTVRGKRFPRFNPVSQQDAALFAAALAGQFTLNGFRNRQLAAGLYPHPPRSPAEAKRRRERTSRLIAKMRGHGLAAKVPRTRLYRVTPHGQRVMAAALRFRHIYFPDAMATAA